MARLNILSHELVHPAQPARSHRKRLDRHAPGRKLVYDGQIEIGVDRLGQGSRNRCSRHVQRMRRYALGSQTRALLDSETVLFVDDRKTEALKIHALRQQRVCADADRSFTAASFSRAALRERAL